MREEDGRQAPARARIVAAAAELLRGGGTPAVTTRAVATRAGVQPPAIYRLFGDKDGLLDAVAEEQMAAFAATKAADLETASAEGTDPVEDLRAGWRSQLALGLEDPHLFRLLIDPERVLRSKAARLGRSVLETRIHRIAETGRLRVSEPRAVAMVQAAGIGALQTLLTMPAAHRDPDLSDAMLDAVLAQILTDAPASEAGGPTAAVVALRAIAPRLEQLSGAERQLLEEWLDRVVSPPPIGPGRK